MSNDTIYEYKIISGREKWPAKGHEEQYANLSKELNSLAVQGWEPYQSIGTGQGFMMLGTGGAGGSMIIIMRRPRT
ncbi:MAG: DUF4177 domain-containing protein [Planctomycetota bacterium]|jgi:hypothetical protein